MVVVPSLIELFLLFLIAALVGSLGQMLAGYYLGGCLVSVVVGYVGALIGLWLARELDLPTLFVIEFDGNVFPLIWSIVGAGLFSAVVGLVTRRHPAA